MNEVQNSSADSVNPDNRLLAKLLINICTLISASFAILVSLLIIIYVISIYNSPTQSKRSFHVSLLLTCNTCLAIICSSTILILIQLATISGDRHVTSLEWIITSGCYIRGYLQVVFIDSIYLSYVLQAGYRLYRIVFNENKYLQTVSSFFYYIIAQWIISFIVIIPTLFTDKNFSNSIVYLPEHFYCQVSMTNAFSIIYSVLVVYLIPLCCMCIIYLWIILHVRHTVRYNRSVTTLKLRRQNKRDTLIIKRICIVIILILTSGIPSVIFFIGSIINGQLHWAFYRLNGMIISISYAFICLSSLYVTPQIYRPIRIRFGSSERHRTTHEECISSSNIIKTQRKTPHPVRRFSSVNIID
jgi:hypothetical protein